MIRNILWDVDGTLFDTYPAITYAISKTINGMGVSIAMNVIDGLVRQSFDHCVETFSQRFKLDPGLFRQKFAESYLTISPANQLPFPGIDKICKMIHQRGGMNVIVTHRNLQSTQQLLETHGLTPCFGDILSVEQGYPRKPDPSMVLAALEKYDLNPTETLLVGDRDLDIQAGRSAGIRTCLFGKASLRTSADFQVSDYHCLFDIITEAG